MNEKSAERPAHLFHRLDTDLRALSDGVVKMGHVVAEQVARALSAFVARDRTAAADVVAADKQVNELERELDERCVLVLALQQPAASDLRFVAAVLKIVTDLERIGDFAVSIARAVSSLAPAPLRAERELAPLGDAALQVLRSALDAFVRRDVNQARQTCTADQPVTAALVALAEELRGDIRHDPEVLDNALALLFVTKHLERIAEHATNIAEMALYTERGVDIRHSIERPDE